MHVTYQSALGLCGRYGPFSLCVIHKEGLCPSSEDIYKLMMMVYACIFHQITKLFPAFIVFGILKPKLNKFKFVPT
jgi:hypothetical protein